MADLAGESCRDMVDAIRLVLGLDPLYRPANGESIYGAPITLGCVRSYMQDGIQLERLTAKWDQAEWERWDARRLIRPNAARPRVPRTLGRNAAARSKVEANDAG